MRMLIGGVVLALATTAAACDSGADANGANGMEADTLAQRANAVTAVDIATFTADPETYTGQEIRLADAPVDSRMGNQAIWLKLPNQGLYLVRAASADAAAAVQPGTRVTAAGTIREMTDSVVTAWIEDGSITADQEMEARYATSYMDAWYVSSGQQATAAGAAQEE